MKQVVWHTAPGGLLVADLGEYRLFVEQVNGWVRYQVHRREEGADVGSLNLLASGNQDDVRAAMDAAERVAGPAVKELEESGRTPARAPRPQQAQGRVA